MECKWRVNFLNIIQPFKRMCHMIFFYLHVEATVVVTPRSPNPSVTQEFQNITLEWNYTLSAAAFSFGQLFNATDTGSPVLIAQKFARGSTNVVLNFQ